MMDYQMDVIWPTKPQSWLYTAALHYQTEVVYVIGTERALKTQASSMKKLPQMPLLSASFTMLSVPKHTLQLHGVCLMAC